jgi:hypothetical protein
MRQCHWSGAHSGDVLSQVLLSMHGLEPGGGALWRDTARGNAPFLVWFAQWTNRYHIVAGSCWKLLPLGQA